MGRLEGKVAIITGASLGMGEATAKLFAAEGAKVVAVARRKEKLDTLVAEVRETGGEIIAVSGDAGVAKDWERVIEETINAYGTINILVNNAGVSPNDCGIETCSEELWENTMNTNIKSIWLGTRAVVPYMRKAGGGSIVNCASGIVHNGGVDTVAYSASKGGVHSLTINTSVTLAKDNIRVNSVNPGFIYTPLIENMGMGTYEQLSEAMSHSTPLAPYVGHPIDVAYAYLYLASDESKWVTGIEIDVDGGARTV